MEVSRVAATRAVAVPVGGAMAQEVSASVVTEVARVVVVTEVEERAKGAVAKAEAVGKAEVVELKVASTARTQCCP